jgi:methylglutaconyl-CoA hydratase
MAADLISVGRDAEGVATLTLDRPGALNAFNRDQVEAFNAALDGLAGDETLRALVVRGAGKVFCAGADVGYLRDMGAGPWEANLADAGDYAAMSRRMRDLPAPVISCVQGGAFGGGIGIVAASDIVVAEETAKFAITEGRFGFTASIMMPYLLPRIGLRQARRWCLTSEVMAAPEAMRIGLIDQVAPAGGLDTALDVLMDDLLRNGPGGVAETKAAMNMLCVPPFDDATVGKSVETFAKGRARDAAREGAAAFYGKRKPAWAPGAGKDT